MKKDMLKKMVISSLIIGSIGLTAMAADPFTVTGVTEYPYNYIAVSTSDTKGNQSNGSMVFSRDQYKSTYHMEKVLINGSLRNFWVRDGYSITIENAKRTAGSTNDCIIVTHKDAATTNDKGLALSNVVTFNNSSATTIHDASLNFMDGSMYGGGVISSYNASNSVGSIQVLSNGNEFLLVNPTDGSKYTALTGSSALARFKPVTYDEKTGNYLYDGKTVETQQMYSIDHKVGVFINTDGSMYTGTVYGRNNEILRTYIDGSTIMSYWGTAINDPNETIKNMTYGQFNSIVGKLEANDATLYGADINHVGVISDTTKGKGIALFTNEEMNSDGTTKAGTSKQVPGAVYINGTGGTNGKDTAVKISSYDNNGTDTGFSIDTGSKVTVQNNVSGKVTGITVNGTAYDLSNISGSWKLKYKNVGDQTATVAKDVTPGDGATITGSKNIVVNAANDGVSIDLNKDLYIGTAGSNNVSISGTDGYIAVTNGSNTIKIDAKSGHVSGLSNVTFDKTNVGKDVSTGGYKKSSNAATESQLSDAYIQIKQETASADKYLVANPAGGNYSVSAKGTVDLKVKDGSSYNTVTIDNVASKTDITNVNTRIDGVDTKVTNVKNDVTNLNTKVDGVQTQVTANTNDIKNIKTDVNNVNTKVTNLDNRVTNNETKISNVQNQVNDINTQVTNNTNNINSNTNDIKNLDNRVTTVEGKVTQNTTDISNVQKQVTTNTNDISNIKTDVKNIDNRVTNLDTKVTNIDNKVTNIDNRVTQNTTDISNLDNRVTKNETDIKTANTNITNLNTKVDGVQTQVTSIDNRVTKTEGDIKNINTTVTNIKNDVTTVDNKVTDLSKQVTKNTGDITNLNTSVTNIKSDVKDIDARVTNNTNRITNVEEVAKKHSSVSTDASGNINIAKGTNENGGVDYKVSLNNNKVTLGDASNSVIIEGSKGTITTTGAINAGNTTISNKGVTVSGNTYITEKGINANNQKITNVADGVKNSDAVNLGQLKTVETGVENNYNSIQSLNSTVNKLGTGINKVGARAAALAGLHPMDFDPSDKFSFSAGYGHYNGESSVALGAYYQPNDTMLFGASSTLGGDDTMWNLTASFKFGQGSNSSYRSKAEMAAKIGDLEKELQDTKEKVDKLIAYIESNQIKK